MLHQLMKSIYVHFPFCESKCSYCDFYSLSKHQRTVKDFENFEKSLQKEILQKRHLLSKPLETLFLGGGTPNLVPFESMQRAFQPLWEVTYCSQDTEWTMEANPSFFNPFNCKMYLDWGINRISLGVQSTQPHLLRTLQRTHREQEIYQALDCIFAAGFKNVSIDLLCGIPQQSWQDLETSLLKLTQWPIVHISCYLLTLPTHHPLFRQQPSEQQQAEQFLQVHQWLTEHDFEHYEISNFSKPHFQSRHNLVYWKRKSYLGLGPAAHSFDARKNLRWSNIASLNQYVQTLATDHPPQATSETLQAEQIHLETWMLQLRLSEGFPNRWLITSEQQKKAALFQKKGLLEIHPQKPQHLRLTAQGFLCLDTIVNAFAFSYHSNILP